MNQYDFAHPNTLRPSIFNVFSECRSIFGASIACRGDFRSAFRNRAEAWELELHDYYASVYGRLPYIQEITRHDRLYRSNTARFIDDDLLSWEFAVSFPQAVQRYTQCSIIRIIHPPKTAGTALVSKLEAHTSIPVWSYDVGGLPDENALKIPDFYDNAMTERIIYARSHITLSDQNHLFRMAPQDKILFLIRKPSEMIKSQLRHVARACFRFRQEHPGEVSIETLRLKANDAEKDFPDHAKSISRWLGFSDMIPEQTPKYQLDLATNVLFRKEFSNPLLRYGLAMAICNSPKNISILDSADVDSYLTSMHGVNDCSIVNDSKEWMLEEGDDSVLEEILFPLTREDTDLYIAARDSPVFWRNN